MATAIDTTPPSESGKPDAVLLGLEADWQRALEVCHGFPDDTDEETRQAAHERWTEVERRISKTPANTPAGIAIKLRIWRYWREDEHLDLCEQVAESCLADAERLAGGAA